MAKMVIHQYVDDIDGSQGEVQTLTFSFEGVDYEIDLGPKNRDRFVKFMDIHTSAARRVGGRSKPRRVVGSPKVPAQPVRPSAVRQVTTLAPSGQTRTQLVRSWYQTQPAKFKATHPLKGNGRIPTGVLEAYREASSTDLEFVSGQ